jgi:hypothetical protein
MPVVSATAAAPATTAPLNCLRNGIRSLLSALDVDRSPADHPAG